MEDLDIEDPKTTTTTDLGESILSRYEASQNEEDRRLCDVVGTMSQQLKEQNLPSTPIAYFGATLSSLTTLSSSSLPHHALDSLTTLLSLVLPRIPVAVVRKKREVVLEVVVGVLRFRNLTDHAAVSGLKCLACSLGVRDNVSWSDVSDSFGVLMGFVTDSRPKVRRQAHACLREVLQFFQGTSALAPASEGITNMFERFLLLAGGSNQNANGEGPKGAQEVLYILDALKECLPLMSMKYKTTVLKYYKTLLELRQHVVTRRVTDSLNMICLNPSIDVSAEPLLDLLCSLALAASTYETSVDNLTFTARLLGTGMKKIYSQNRQICVVKLPTVFSTLKDILASEHEEAVVAAIEAIKSLISNSIDESLIRQGVDQIKMNKNMDSRQSAPTVIEKVCATVESLLGYHYAAIWDMIFQVISMMFDKLGNYSAYLLRGTMKNLADMQKLSNDDFSYRKPLHDCLGSALSVMGPETFLSFLPLNLEADDLSDVNIWLFPILKQYTFGAHLSFFTETVLGWIGSMRRKSQKLEQVGRIVAARSVDALVYSLWSLLPSFCNYPLDTAESFNDLWKTLCNVIREQHEVRGLVCSALQNLVQQNKKIVDGRDELSSIEVGLARDRVVAHYTRQAALDNIKVLRESARDFLTVLSGILLESSEDDGGCLQSTISEFALIADKEVVRKVFLRAMRRLLEVTQRASTTFERARLFDLAVSLLSGLDAEEINVLFTAVKPALQDSEGSIQKKAYKVLSIILQNCDWFLSSKLEELLQLMLDVLPLCHFSAKRHRLDCLYYIIVHISKEDSEQRNNIICSFLTEIILALKEANKKTRNRAYDLLVQIGHACGDQENGGRRENLYHFFNMVAGGMAGETPHMVSATVKGLARLAYEFSDLVSTAYKLLPTTFILLQRKNREIIKANLGLLKVLVAKSASEGLQIHLGSLVDGLLKWQVGTKNHFKAKIKHLLELLVRKCGLDAVKAVMPEEHMKLLRNIRKIKERKERKLAAGSQETKSHLSRATTSRLSRWNHTNIFSDSDDEETEGSDDESMGTRTILGRRSNASSQLKSKASSLRSKRHKTDKSLPDDFDELEGEPLDLLDRQKTRSALRSSTDRKQKQDSDDEPEIDPEGRLIVREGEKLKKKKHSDPDLDSRSEASSHKSISSGRKTQKRQKTSESGWSYTGHEYGSKKAGGDLKRKDKLEPYAYWPLDRKMISRRPEHRAAARKGMASVVKLTKKLEGKSASAALSMKLMKLKPDKKKGNKRKAK